MLVSFHLVTSVVVVNGTCLLWIQWWHWFTEVTARLWTWLNSLVEFCCCLSALVLCHHPEYHTIAFMLMQWSISMWTSLLHQSCSAYAVIWVTPWAWICLHWLYAGISVDSLKCWNILCILILTDEWVLLQLLSSRSCQTILKTYSIRKYLKCCKSQILYLL